MTINDMLKSFIMDKRLQGLADESISSYKNILTGFVEYIGNETKVATLTRENVNDYIYSLFDRELAKATISTYVRNTRIFLTWIYDNYDLQFDPRKIKVPRTPKKNVHILSSTEIEYLFMSIKTVIPWISARNRSIIALMLDSGLRQCEICTLERKNVDFERNIIKVTGKGAKDRTVSLGELSKYFLRYYLQICPYKDTEFVYLERLGKVISRSAVKSFVNRLKHETGIDLSSHKLRHNFATNYCLDNLRENGTTNVFDLSILMGHESLETTKKYEHFAHEIIASENSISHLDRLNIFEKVVANN